MMKLKRAETNSGSRAARRCARRLASAIFNPALAVLFVASLQLSACMDPSAMGGLGSMGMGSHGFGASARTPQERALEVEPLLTAAGFQTLSPQQPAHQQQLAGLPALQLNYYTTPEGQQRFWYADPQHCHCLYVGDAAAYQRYANLRMQNQQLESAQQMQAQQQMQMQQYQMQQYQMQQYQQSGPFGPMGPPMGGSSFGFGMGGPGMGVIF
jgi:hypothetical protein